ncbi:MAG: ABC transporter substrate-binding protein [Desulfobacteraceae bacterium]|nr:ABC transporter substrate-binding protein [Desulfobacteraceae bacterium]
MSCLKERFRGSFYVLLILCTAFFLMGMGKRPDTTSIKLGATFPLTGEVASYGQKAKRGIEMAVDDINAKGGVLGRHIEVDFQDDRHDKKEAVTIMTKFATIDKVPVVFGSAGSSVSLAIAPLANRHKVIQISPISSSSTLTTEGGDYFFRTVPADDIQAEILSKWVFESGARKVAIVYTNNSWGKPLADGFLHKFELLGGKVVTSEGVQESMADFRTIIAKLNGMKGLDTVVSPTYPKEGGIFVRQAKELGFNIPLFGGDNWGSPEFLKIAGDAAEGVYFTAPSESTSPAFSKFAQQYKAKHGEEPDVFGAYSYDAAMAIFKAIEAAGTTEAEKVRQALLKVSFTGVSGDIAFRPNGDLQSEAFAKKTIKSGQAVDVK